MATNKMLIDASHPEETRVAVVRGNRIEEFDFESLEKQQLRGNIYLAKVTRVEPSLQAAFVDYGGNRHGFLAFSEIHPDYYQIPVADRQALIDEEAADARASREADDLEDEKPKAKKSRKPRVSKKTAEDEAPSTDTDSDHANVETSDAEAVAGEESPVEAAEEAPKKTRRPRRRTKKAAEKTEPTEDDAAQLSAGNGEEPVEGETSVVDVSQPSEDVKTAQSEQVEEPAIAEEGEQQDSTDTPPKSMAAMIETDSISEPASDGEDGEEESSTEAPIAEEESTPAPKKRRRSTRSKAKTAKVDPETQVAEGEKETSDAASDNSETPLESSKEATSADIPEELSEDGADQTQETTAEDDEGAAKPSKPKRRRSTRRKRASSPEESEVEKEKPDIKADASTTDEDEDDVESVGQEDALEEVPERFKSRRQYKIQEVIKRRQVLLVQVVKEERGNKGAALTTYLSLAGRYSVLMPNTARGGGISRKITNANDRKRLKAIANELEVPEGMGVILRTAGASRTKAEINRDFEYLIRLWEKVRNLTLSSSAPCLVYEEGSLIKRSIRDLYNKDIGEILVSGEAGYQEASDFMGMLMPKHVNNVKMYDDAATIFARYGVEAQLERMVTPQVTLKSGGYLVMNQTEALVAIDVNSGRSTREHSIEDTALQTNLEAAEEVARQLRLRDLAGLIVIDFIDMEEKRNNRAVEKRLKDCLKNDRARIQVGRISHFGLLEMSRQRIRASVLESTMDACPHCQGMGYVRSDSAIALHVFRAIEEHLSKHNRFNIVVKTSASIALYILNHKRMALLDLEARFGLKIVIEGDLNVVGQEFEIERGEPSRGKPNNGPKAAYNGGTIENDNSAHGETEAADEDTGDRKKRRKRRRGKRRDFDGENQVDAEPSGTETQNNDSTEQPASDADRSDNENVDGEEVRSKSRRGRRGGRRKKAGSENGVEQVDDGNVSQAPTSEEIAKGSSAEIESSAHNGNGEEPENEPRRPRRSTRRPRKENAKSAETIETTDAVAAETHSNVEVPAADSAISGNDDEHKPPHEPPKRTRRSTRRPKKEMAPTEQENADGQEMASTSATLEDKTSEAASTPEVVASAEETSGDDAPKKRGGWWSRGGGFFG